MTIYSYLRFRDLDRVSRLFCGYRDFNCLFFLYTLAASRHMLPMMFIRSLKTFAQTGDAPSKQSVAPQGSCMRKNDSPKNASSSNASATGREENAAGACRGACSQGHFRKHCKNRPGNSCYRYKCVVCFVCAVLTVDFACSHGCVFAVPRFPSLSLIAR